MAGVLTQLLIRIGADTTQFERSIQKVASETIRVGNSLQYIGNAMTTAVTLPIVAAGAAIVKLGMNAVESENLFKVAMGDMAGQATTLATGMSNAMRLNPYQVKQNIGTFYVMFDSMNLATDASYEMATGLTQLAYDISSLYNISRSDAFEKLKSGISGEVKPLRELGISVYENTIQQYALQKGFIKQGETMDETMKMYVRYLVILDRTNKAQGDLTRTIADPANTIRGMIDELTASATRMGEQFTKSDLFKQFIQAAQDVIDMVTKLMDGFQKMSPKQQKMIVDFLLIAAATGPVLLAMGKITTAVAGMIKIYGVAVQAIKAYNAANAASSFVSGVAGVAGSAGKAAAGAAGGAAAQAAAGAATAAAQAAAGTAATAATTASIKQISSAAFKNAVAGGATHGQASQAAKVAAQTARAAAQAGATAGAQAAAAGAATIGRTVTTSLAPMLGTAPAWIEAAAVIGPAALVLAGAVALYATHTDEINVLAEEAWGAIVDGVNYMVNAVVEAWTPIINALGAALQASGEAFKWILNGFKGPETPAQKASGSLAWGGGAKADGTLGPYRPGTGPYAPDAYKKIFTPTNAKDKALADLVKYQKTATEVAAEQYAAAQRLADAEQKAAEKKAKAEAAAQARQDKLNQSARDMVSAIMDATKQFANFTGMFEIFERNPISAERLSRRMGAHLGVMQEWASAMKSLKGRVSDALYRELFNMGPSAVDQIKALAGMSSTELASYNQDYNDIQKIAGTMGKEAGTANWKADQYIASQTNNIYVSGAGSVETVVNRVLEKLKAAGYR